MKNIPTDSDWKSEPWGIDSKDAFEHFRAKNINEASDLFEENFRYYAEDLLYMPKVCFQFYLNSLIEFLGRDSSRKEVESPHVFFSIIDSRAQDILDCDTLLQDVVKMLKYLEAEKDSFGEFVDWRGDYDQKLQNCLIALK